MAHVRCKRKWDRNSIIKSDDGVEIDMINEDITIEYDLEGFDRNYYMSFEECKSLYSKLSGVMKIISK